MKRVEMCAAGVVVALVLAACGSPEGDDPQVETPDAGEVSDVGGGDEDAGDVGPDDVGSDAGDGGPDDVGSDGGGDEDANDAEVVEYPVLVTLEGEGGGAVRSEPAGLDCSDSCHANLPAGEISLSVDVLEGSEFVEWAGDCSGTENPLVLTLSEPMVCRAIVGLAPSASWTRSYGVGGAHLFRDLALVGDGSFIAVGYTSILGAGQDEAIIARIDEAGEVIWQKSIGDEGTNRLSAIEATGEGDFIAVGQTHIDASDDWAMWALRIDAQGTILWQKAYQRTTEVTWHNLHADAFSIQVLGEDRYLIGGSVTGSDTTGYSIYPGALTIDGEGTLLENALYPLYLDWVRDVRRLSDGGLVFAGGRGEGWGATAALLIRTRADGTTAWRIASTNWEGGYEDVVESADGSIIAVGYVERAWRTDSVEDVVVIKINAAGEFVWQRRYGTSEGNATGRDVVELADGRIAVVGTVTSADRRGGWVLVLDANGNLVHERSFAGEEGTYTTLAAVEVDDDGRAYVVGASSSARGEGGGYVSAFAASLDSVEGGEVCQAQASTNYAIANTTIPTSTSDTEIVSREFLEVVPELDVVDIAMVNEAMCGG